MKHASLQKSTRQCAGSHKRSLATLPSVNGTIKPNVCRRTPSRRVKTAFRTEDATETASATTAVVVLDEEDKRHFRRLDIDEAALKALTGYIPTDFYQLLGIGVDFSAPLVNQVDEDKIRKAYRRLQKLCHPDIAGEAASAVAGLLNVAYTTLSDEESRMAYDDELKTYRRGVGTYTGRPMSEWAGPAEEPNAVFVDETSCIGCAQCAIHAPKTFFMEEDWGRARVHTQWGDSEEAVKTAISTCPVDCIHYVERAQLPLLEYVMQQCKREDGAMMGRRRGGNMGTAPASEDPFMRASIYSQKREALNFDQVVANGARLHDAELAAAIGRAWLSLPEDIREKGWPNLSDVLASSGDSMDSEPGVVVILE